MSLNLTHWTFNFNNLKIVSEFSKKNTFILKSLHMSLYMMTGSNIKYEFVTRTMKETMILQLLHETLCVDEDALFYSAPLF